MPVTSSYFICTTPRTGSSCSPRPSNSPGSPARPGSILNRTTKRIGSLAWASRRNAEYFEKFLAAGTTPNGVFGAKVHWHQFVHLRAKLRSIHGNGIVRSRSRAAHLPRPAVHLPDPPRQGRAGRVVLQGAPDGHLARDDARVRNRPGNCREPRRIRPRADRSLGHALRGGRSELAAATSRGRDRAVRGGLRGFPRGLRVDRAGDPPLSEHPDPRGIGIVPPRLQKLADEVSQEWVARYKELKRPARRLRETASLSYFISTTPRTGGFLLAEALESTGIAGRPREYFDPVCRETMGRTPGDQRRMPSISRQSWRPGRRPTASSVPRCSGISSSISWPSSG